MRQVKKLAVSERVDALAALDGWAIDHDVDGIRKRYTFVNVVEAFAFMTKIVILAEKGDHHPEWCNVWNCVDILLTTHDVGGLSRSDIALAQAIDESRAARRESVLILGLARSVTR